MQWLNTVRYDETSPSGLVWDVDVLSGQYYKTIKAKVGQVAGSYSGNKRGGCYFKFQYNKIKYLCHKVIWQMFNGEIPDGLVVDHIDGDTSNNKLGNLRLVTNKVNGRNTAKHKNNRSGSTGVYLKSQNGYDSWVAQWTDQAGKKRCKAFSVNKYGDTSRLLAESFRAAQIKSSLDYTERHGKGNNE